MVDAGCDENVGRMLERFAAEPLETLPHLLVCGPTGSGKKHHARCLIQMICKGDADAHQLSPIRNISPMHITRSGKHWELPFEEGALIDRLLFAGRRPVVTPLVVHDMDRYTVPDQLRVRRPMETLSNLRIILITKNLSKVSESLRSRCAIVRVPSPDIPRIERVLARAHVPSKRRRVIARGAQHNLHEALACAEIIKRSPSGVRAADVFARLPNGQMNDLVDLLITKPEVPRAQLATALERGLPPDELFAACGITMAARMNNPDIISIFAEHQSAGTHAAQHLEAALLRARAGTRG